ncbi:MAG: carboxymethylenebutenolidase [Ilumatobacteraceae bacterium]|jgi:carboxymethylenebutenolidase
MTNDAMRAETVWLEGAVDASDSRGIETYLAQPLDRESFGSIVVIHHMPGFDEPSREITRNFAAGGIAAICPNLYSREGQGKSPKEIFQLAMAQSGVPDNRLLADVSLAADRLRSLPGSNGKVGVIGFCSGGRQAFMAACALTLDAAIDCYGAFVVVPPAEETKLTIAPIIDRVDALSCPLLGIFGVEDQNPSPAEVAATEDALRAAGKDFEFHSFQSAGHAFLAVNRPSYRQEAAGKAWPIIWDFVRRHLA